MPNTLSSPLELKQQRAEILDELKAIKRAAELGKRSFTKDEKSRCNELKAEDDKIRAELAEREEEEKLRGWIDDTDQELAESPGRRTEATKPGKNNPKGVDGDPEKKFKSLGEQLQAVAGANHMPVSHRDPRLQWSNLAPSGMSEGTPSDGGFMVHFDFAAELIRRTYEFGEILQRVRGIPISGNANGLKINAIDEQSRTNGNRWGGIQVFWQNEADTPAAKKPKLRQMELNLKKLIGLCYMTDELMADARALEEVVMQGFSEEFSFVTEDTIVNGTGSGQMQGILNAGCLVTVAAESGQATKTVVKSNIDKMWARMWGRSRRNACWFVNQDIEPQLFNLSQVVGVGGVPVFLPPGGLSQSPYSTLYGRPVIPVEYCATLGTVGDIILADFSQYLMIDKGKMQADSSIHVRFINDEMTFRFIYRTDGQPTWNTALTPKNGTNTLSPFIALAAR